MKLIDIDGAVLLNLLKQIEYSKPGDYCKVCPVCDANFIKYGHEKDCGLNSSIREIEEKLGNLKIVENIC